MIVTRIWPESPNTPPVYPYSKWNVLKWFENEEGLDPSYLPTRPLIWRQVFWFFRNFMFNFARFVVGFEDRWIEVTGPEPIFTPSGNECEPPVLGWRRWTVRPLNQDGIPSWFRFPFYSYYDGTTLFFISWHPTGGRLASKWNRPK